MPDRDSLSSLNKQNELDSSVMPVSQDCLKSIAQNFGVVLLYHGTFDDVATLPFNLLGHFISVQGLKIDFFLF